MFQIRSPRSMNQNSKHKYIIRCLVYLFFRFAELGKIECPWYQRTAYNIQGITYVFGILIHSLMSYRVVLCVSEHKH